MDSILFIIVIALGLSTTFNIFLKRIGASEIIGYIFTGTALVYLFDINELGDTTILQNIGEFGIVFLMFSIGLEISLSKMESMKSQILGNGFIQATLTAMIMFSISYFIFQLNILSSIIISSVFALSSTAIVLGYLKSSKEIHQPYGQKSLGLLIFQDIAVIPLLIFIGFMTTQGDKSILNVLVDTFIHAIVVMGLLFSIGRIIVSWLLHFSASSDVDELFMGSVLFIVIGAAILASYFGFEYSLGAFAAGMIIAETKYHHKVEYDIAPFKDILLGTFFIVIGMKIDVFYFLDNFSLVIALFFLIILVKIAITFFVLNFSTKKATALKSALLISPIDEFSFAIFAIASSSGLLEKEIESLLILVVIFSMIVTPFFIPKISKFIDKFFEEEFLDIDLDAYKETEDHVIVCGYSRVGQYTTQHLDMIDAPYVIVDNSPKQVKVALDEGKDVILGDISKRSILEALNAQKCTSIIITLNNVDKKRLICEAILKQTQNINLIVKVASLGEKEALKDLNVTMIVDDEIEISRILVERMMSCQLKYK